MSVVRYGNHRTVSIQQWKHSIIEILSMELSVASQAMLEAQKETFNAANNMINLILFPYSLCITSAFRYDGI